MKGTITPPTTYGSTFSLFTALGGYSSTAKIYYTIIWNNGTLVRNMIPAVRNSDYAVGMYDTVNNVFYANAGSGTFSYG